MLLTVGLFPLLFTVGLIPCFWFGQNPFFLTVGLIPPNCVGLIPTLLEKCRSNSMDRQNDSYTAKMGVGLIPRKAKIEFGLIPRIACRPNSSVGLILVGLSQRPLIYHPGKRLAGCIMDLSSR